MRITLCALALLALALPIAAQDAPALKVGATIFADYTFQAAPEAKDADGNAIQASSFNVSRAYINVTGSLNKRITFRITPDITRETGSGSSLAGSQQFRLKYAFAQLSLDEWTAKGSFVRFGMQQTPLLDSVESIYRYRFQGTLYAEREGYLSSSDSGVSVRYVLPKEYGDVHAGYYNGDGYAKAEANDQKAFQVRASVRPLPKSPLGKGLRVTAFAVSDAYVQDASRERLVLQATYEHKRVHAGFDAISTKDRTSSAKPEIAGSGWSVWATPKLGSGWELLLRHDDTRPDDRTGVHRRRNIAGVAYWLPEMQKVSTAVLLDYDSLDVTGKARETRYGVKLLLAF
jgi:Phosphate-selective porin O and P